MHQSSLQSSRPSQVEFKKHKNQSIWRVRRSHFHCELEKRTIASNFKAFQIRNRKSSVYSGFKYQLFFKGSKAFSLSPSIVSMIDISPVVSKINMPTFEMSSIP